MDDIKPSVSDMDKIIQVANRVVQDTKHSPPSLAGTAAPTSEEDNMDYDSDDDDDSKSNNSSSNRKRQPKGEIKRSHHNILERKRRDLIKDSFTKLREAVPTLHNEKASRAQILKRAADFIQHIHRRNESTRADIEELARKNSELENRISSVTVKIEPIKADIVKE